MLEQMNIFEGKQENIQEIAKKLKELRELEKIYSDAYYDGNDNIVTDAEYDKLKHEILDLEEKYPSLKEENGVSKRIGSGKVSNLFTKVTHKVPMQSLQDVFTYEEIYDFDKRVKKVIDGNVNYVVEVKIDGLSLALEYENGNLVRGITRGSGTIGEDVTENVVHIPQIPKKIPYMGKVTVRRRSFHEF